MARVHLRGGMLAIARAALEQMAGAGTLDTEALVDLAEVRWRSGDLEGAAEAARAHLAFGGREPMAELIAAEALLRAGRQPEAYRYTDVVERRVGKAIDVLFAGEQRGAAWSADAGWMDRGATLAGRLGLLVGGAEVAAPTPETWPLAPVEAPPGGVALAAASVAAPQADERTGTVVAARAQPPQAAPAPPSAAGRPYEATAASHPGGRRPPIAPALPGPVAGRELELAERLFREGRFQTGADRLAVVLRLDPALAPVILTLADKAIAAGGAGAEGLSALHVVRGDAYRGMGREMEAQTAYQQALGTLAGRPSSPFPGTQPTHKEHA